MTSPVFLIFLFTVTLIKFSTKKWSAYLAGSDKIRYSALTTYELLMIVYRSNKIPMAMPEGLPVNYFLLTYI